MSKEQRDRLRLLAAISDAEIDTADIPEVLDWSRAARGRPQSKEAVTISLDADILAWFRGLAGGEQDYQTEINRVLRGHVDRLGRSQNQA